MVAKPVQLEEAPYIARNRPDPPPPPSLDERHYHLEYNGAGGQGKALSHACWCQVEEAA